MSSTRRRIDDPLWKAIIEQTFTHFLTFFFLDAALVFDLQRKVDYLDKEFETLFPPEPHGKGLRYVDKLVRVFLKSGAEQFILCHIEVQSGKSKEDLAKRMFQYYYKIVDKYQAPVMAIVILADAHRDYHPKYYRQRFMGTDLFYRFNSYKILQQKEEELQANENPFAVVVLTALWAIKHQHVADDMLRDMKHRLYDEMLKRAMGTAERKAIYDFLTYYVGFQESDGLSKFVNELENKLGRRTIMNTKEYLLDKAKREGIDIGIEKGIVEGIEKGIVEGIEKGRVEGIEKGIEKGRVLGIDIGIEKGRLLFQKAIIENSIIRFGLSDADIAELVNCSKSLVTQIRADLEKRNS